MNYYQVVLIKPIGQEIAHLSYCSLKSFKIGTIVECPVRNRLIAGVIIKKIAKPAFATKEIVSLKSGDFILPEHLLKIADFISTYYGASLDKVYANIVPAVIGQIPRKTSDDLAHAKKVTIRSPRPTLTGGQKEVLKKLSDNDPEKPFYLFGVTGSGKTEIYLRMIEETLKRGDQTIVLVPEISLTPQFVQIFCSSFGEKNVALIHSYLPPRERLDNWRRVESGEAKIIIGSRSAIFAPCHKLGLIIIDEEHESSYKQDQTPRYQTITVAKKIATITKSRLIFGSATPSVEGFYQAEKGNYHLLFLNKRIVQESMPKVEIVDMRTEFKKKNYSIFSEKLLEEIEATLKNKKQVLLFINRRGMSTFVTCRDCGYVSVCPSCDLALTFHYSELKLICHHCGFKEQIPTLCPNCKSSAIKYFGTGTERVEVELKKLIPEETRLARMDRDTTRKQGKVEEIYRQFAEQETDILIGTQMITKGWDLANIALVGIISIDPILNMPDYTSSERAFSLLTQVAGRTGRGYHPGKVILQTYNPDHPSVRFAQKHDYKSFYDQEIKIRAEFSYPPFVKLLKIRYNHSDKNEAIRKTTQLYQDLKSQDARNLEVLPPVPALNERIAGKYRWQIIIKIKDEKLIPSLVSKIKAKVDHNWSIDVDPQDLN